MSLYGSGRREGISAALLIATLVVLVHLLAAWSHADPLQLRELPRFLVPALAGSLCDRFLRAQGRSRYAAFLAGCAYGLSPWLVSMTMLPREQFAAALAPLALEAAVRCDRPSMRRTWLPWTWLCIALPFVAGVTVVGVACALLCAAGFVRTTTCGDRDDERPSLPGILTVAVLGAAAAAHLVWLDALSPWLGAQPTVSADDVLTTYRSAPGSCDAAALLRVPGPLLLVFMALGLLRRQRHVDTPTWLALALVGVAPALLSSVPWLANATPLLGAVPTLPAAAFWLTLLALTVLATAGLDDFLDNPVRRRTALPWLLAGVVASAPLLPIFSAKEPRQEWPVMLTMMSLATLLPLWRRLGILRFKNVLAAVALMTLAIPPLQALVGMHVQRTLPAVPLGDVGTHPLVWTDDHPAWHYTGLLAAIGATTIWALVVAWRHRRRVAGAAPVARGAITRPRRPQR